uniref:Ubiquitin-like protease family profile domain-containing protein n=1 Tax=Oryza punctata TaxID=4537 RepID=A0A0E0LN63_ORYPU
MESSEEQSSDLQLRPMKKTKNSKSDDFETDKKMDVSNIQTFNESKPLLHDNQTEENKQKKVSQTYDYLPQDYDMTDDDICAQITIETSSSTDVLVKINDIALKQNQLLPLLDENEYLDDNIVGAYIYCIRDQAHLHGRSVGKSYFETPLISGLFKRDGKFGIAENKDVHSNFITKIARDYLTNELLASILIRWKTNTAQITPKSEQNDDIGDDSDCVEILSSTDNEKKFTSKRHIDDSQESKPSCNQTKYQSLMSILSRMGVNELISGLCNYIKSIDCAQTLQKVWVQTSKPYTIRLTLQKLQGILKEGEPMDHDCFNIIVRKLASDDIQLMKKNKGTISKHYLDMRFWNIVDSGRHRDYRKILNVQQLVESVCNGHDIDNNISKYKLVDSYTNRLLWYLRSYHIGSRNQNSIYIRPDSA